MPKETELKFEDFMPKYGPDVTEADEPDEAAFRAKVIAMNARMGGKRVNSRHTAS